MGHENQKLRVEGEERSRKDVAAGLPQRPQPDAGNTPQTALYPKSGPEVGDADGRY